MQNTRMCQQRRYGGGPSISRVVTQNQTGALTVDIQRATPTGADAATAARADHSGVLSTAEQATARGGVTNNTAGLTRRIVTRKGRAPLAPPPPPHQQEQEQASEKESEWETCSGEGSDSASSSEEEDSEEDSGEDSEGDYDSYGSDASCQCAACVQAARAARATAGCNCEYCMGHEDEEDSLPELEDDWDADSIPGLMGDDSDADSIPGLMSDDGDEDVPPPPPPPAGHFEGGLTAAFGNLLGLGGMGGVFPIAFGIGGVRMDGGEQPPPAVMDALFRTLVQPPPRRAESDSPATTTTAAAAAARRSTATAAAHGCNVPNCPCRSGAAAAADDDDDLPALLSDDEAAPASVPGTHAPTALAAARTSSTSGPPARRPVMEHPLSAMSDVWADTDAGPERDCRFYVSLYRRKAVAAAAAAAAAAAHDTEFLVEAVGELGVDVHSMQVQVRAARSHCEWRGPCSPCVLVGQPS